MGQKTLAEARKEAARIAQVERMAKEAERIQKQQEADRMQKQQEAERIQKQQAMSKASSEVEKNDQPDNQESDSTKQVATPKKVEVKVTSPAEFPPLAPTPGPKPPVGTTAWGEEAKPRKIAAEK